MLGDVNQLTQSIPIITAVATLIAAIVAASAAVSVAIVNGWFARRTAAESAHRAFREKRLEKTLQRCWSEIDLGGVMAAAFSNNPTAMKKLCLARQVKAMPSTWRLSIIPDDPQFEAALDHYVYAEEKFLEHVNELTEGEDPLDPAVLPSSRFMQLYQELVVAIALLEVAGEVYVFRTFRPNRSWRAILRHVKKHHS